MKVGSCRGGVIRSIVHHNDDDDGHGSIFGELLQHPTKAILSSYVIDQDWLVQQLQGVQKVHLILDNGRKKMNGLIKLAIPGWTASFPPFPPFPQYGVMHSKIMILFYGRSEWMRIIISSSNLCAHDFSDVENIAYVEDFPFISVVEDDCISDTEFDSDLEDGVYGCNDINDISNNSKNNKSNKNNKTLKDDLKELLKVLHVPEEIIKGQVFDNFLFPTRKNEPRLIWSVPGMHRIIEPPNSSNAVGIERLKEVALNFSSSSPPNIATVECQGSSLGWMGPQFIKDFLSALGGRSADLKVVFPTEKYAVRNGGISKFGTIFCKEKYFKPREIFYRCQAKDGRPLHSKIVSCWNAKNVLVSLYVGSANFTVSAWGRKVGDGRRNSLLVSNYELGIWIGGFDACSACSGYRYDLSQPSSLSSSHPPPIPYKRDPLEAYSKDDRPWIQEEHTDS